MVGVRVIAEDGACIMVWVRVTPDPTHQMAKLDSRKVALCEISREEKIRFPLVSDFALVELSGFTSFSSAFSPYYLFGVGASSFHSPQFVLRSYASSIFTCFSFVS